MAVNALLGLLLMATSLIYGFESGKEPAVTAGHGGETNAALSGSAAATFQTSIVRSGSYAMRVNPTATTSNVFLGRRTAGGTYANDVMSARFWLRIASLPSANTRIWTQADSSANLFDGLYLNTDGKLAVARGTTVDATSTNALSADGLWHRIEVDCGWNAGAGRRVYVDGVEWASIGTTASAAKARMRLGVIDSCTTDLYFDDVVADNATLGGTLWSDWKVILLPVVSDNTINSWTGGAGGTTNLWEALNNVPPTGTTAGSDTDTSQIQTATNPGTAYDANCLSYSAAGLTAGDTIRAVCAIVSHGEGVATGTKTGDIQIVSNPAAGAATFDYGQDGGALGAYPALWLGNESAVVESPSVTLGTQPVVRVRKTDTGTRETHVTWLGIYVAYTPSAGPAQDTPELYGRPYGLHGQSQMHQLIAQ